MNVWGSLWALTGASSAQRDPCKLGLRRAIHLVGWCLLRNGLTVRRHHLLALAVLAVVAVWSVLEASTGIELGLHYLAPAVILVVLLVLGRYVGEEKLVAFSTRLSKPRRRPTFRLAIPRSADRVIHRGGRLVAASLAKRPPPHRAPHLTG